MKQVHRSKEERDVLVYQIRKCLNEGLSRAQIGERVGLNKNQVGGLIALHIKHYVHPRNKPAPVEFVPPASGPRPRPSHPVTIEAMPIVKTDLSFEPPEGKVNVWNVRHGQCRWVNEDGFFCGDPTGAPSKVYCDAHHALCFQKPQPKRPRKRPCYYQPSQSENFV